jgi:polysaccharide biosynthesis transport protein
LEFRSRRVSNIDEVVRGLKMRFVGSMPPLSSRASQPGQPKGGSGRGQNQMAESIETTRTVLLHAAESESLRVIVVTSAVGGEGKTLTCSHLAASLARAGRKTLLIDADLRRPVMQRLFNLALEPGFSELLRGEVDVRTAVQPGPIAGLSIIAAGRGDDRSIQALSQPILGQLFKSFRDEYDFVIVDSAPVLPVADSQVICQQADGVIFAILRDVSRLPQIYSAHERLASLRIRILGAVVNGTEGPVYGSSYPYSPGNPGAKAG